MSVLNNFTSFRVLIASPTSEYTEYTQLNSLDFTINTLFMKLFKTNNIDIVKYSQYCFGFEMPSELWAKRISKLHEKIANCSNSFVVRFSQV